jgi:hypothetical protein
MLNSLAQCQEIVVSGGQEVLQVFHCLKDLLVSTRNSTISACMLTQGPLKSNRAVIAPSW